MNYEEIAHMTPFPVNGQQEKEWQAKWNMRWTRQLADCAGAHIFQKTRDRDRTEILCGFEEGEDFFRFDSLEAMNEFIAEKLAAGWWLTFKKYPTPHLKQDCIHWMNPESRASSRYAGLTFG